MTTPSRTGTPAQIDASGGNGSTSVTVPADCNGIVAMWSHWDGNGGSSLSSLTLNGVSFTEHAELAEGATTDESGVGVATLMSPATGSQTVAWTWSGGGARSEGGEIVLVFYKDCNTSDPVRAASVNAAVDVNAADTSVGSTASTDLVVGFYQVFDGAGTAAISGVTAFINNATLNSHLYDVGDASGLTGTVTIGNIGTDYYSAAAAISLKESTGGATDYEGTGDLDAQNSTVSGAGLHGRVSTGALSAQAATISGAGVVGRTGAGALSAQATSISGAAIIGRAATGDLEAQSTSIAGAGVVGRTATGDLEAQDAAIDGSGTTQTATFNATGDLQAQSAQIAGSAVLNRVGSGVLESQNAIIVGDGDADISLETAKTGTGGIDPVRRGRKSIVKPTGTLHLPKKQRREPSIADVRAEEARRIQAEVSEKLATEFGVENAELAARAAMPPVAAMSMLDIEQEIGALLRKKIRTQEDELLLLVMMAAAQA